MKKLVSESIQEFRGSRVDEGIFDRVGAGIKKAVGAVKGFFEKIGKFFFAVGEDGQVEPVIAPVNVGIMVKDNMINTNAVYYIPSEEDLSLEPALRSLTPEQLIQKRGGDNLRESLQVQKNINEARVPLKHPNAKVKNIDKDKLFRRIRMSIKNPQGKPIMVWGAPGIGKTQIVKAVLKARGEGRLIDVQTSKMAPDDWALPAILKMEPGEMETGTGVSAKTRSQQPTMRAVDLPKSWLPVYKPTGDPETDEALDKALGKGVIFLDELSRASGSVQNTCLKLVDERTVGDAKIGSGWAIISASNRGMDDPASVQDFSTALGNRFAQMNYVPDFVSWKEWAIDKIDPRILDFLEFNQDFFYTLDDEDEEGIFASPRSWEAASNDIAMVMQDAKDEGYRVTSEDLEEMIGENVGTDIATELATFLRLLETFSKEDIRRVLEDPDKAPLPKKAGSSYDQSEANAVISLVITNTRGREVTPEEFANFSKYLVRLDNGSLATRAFKMIFDVHPYMHKELGEIDGKDKYKEGADIFVEKYEHIF